MDMEHPWWNPGYMTVHVIFNILAVFAIYWLARKPKSNA
jgi:ABC-type multidrug transport system permease subunit